MNIWIKETRSKEVVGENQTTWVFRMHFLEIETYYRNFFFYMQEDRQWWDASVI
jgi:hypothetical protein